MPLNEFDIIAEYFAPLAGPGGLGLSDDAALLRVADGHDLVSSLDTMVADVHFRSQDPPDLIARKLLRVNLSDLAAMGAEPVGYLLSCAWPGDISAEWLAGFANGLGQDQEEFSLSLLGGDTVRTPGPMTLSLTILGQVPRGQALRRNGARPGDAIYVSGSIGDAALGLALLQDRPQKFTGTDPIDPREQAYLSERYQLPRPRLALGQRLRGMVHACADVSDGLLADLGHICAASNCGAVVQIDNLPVSPAARKRGMSLPDLASAGDDYELVFTADPSTFDGALIAASAGISLSRIGAIRAEPGVELHDASGQSVVVETPGYRHF